MSNENYFILLGGPEHFRFFEQHTKYRKHQWFWTMLKGAEKGDNDYGYTFGIGRIGDRWVGFAVGDTGEDKQMMFLLPGISEDYMIGLSDRETCILMTGAVAQMPQYGYGGIERWFVPEELRGKPEAFMCPDCGEVNCDEH